VTPENYDGPNWSKGKVLKKYFTSDEGRSVLEYLTSEAMTQKFRDEGFYFETAEYDPTVFGLRGIYGQE
jgi:hypothetical protein